MNGFPNVGDFICDLMYTALDLNLVYTIRVMQLFTKYLDEWRKYIVMMNDEHENDEYCNQLFKTYRNILEAYKLYKTIFQVLVSYFKLYVLILFIRLQHHPLLT